jgi:hypothetical protein
MPSSASYLRIAFALALGAHAAAAQERCPTPTATARAYIDDLLNNDASRPWLVAHGITATKSTSLTPLVDETDSTRCQALAARLTGLPAYFFQAGSYVLATNARPFVADSVTGLIHVAEVPRQFVFDSTNAVVFVPGMGATSTTSPPGGRSGWTFTASSTWSSSALQNAKMETRPVAHPSRSHPL